MTLIRDATTDDETAWRVLWEDYVAFYQADVPTAVTALTWRRALDPAVPLLIRIAEKDRRVVGFSASVVHIATWTADPVCYLEDLYVAESARGDGIGKALIEDLIALGQASGWSRLYWHTQVQNQAARMLYNRFIAADDFVRYRLPL